MTGSTGANVGMVCHLGTKAWSVYLCMRTISFWAWSVHYAHAHNIRRLFSRHHQVWGGATRCVQQGVQGDLVQVASVVKVTL